MKKHLINLFVPFLLVFVLLFCACQQDPTPAPEDEITFSSEIDVLLKSGTTTIRNVYRSDYFRDDACDFDKDLALLSFALADSTSDDNAVNFLSAMKFSNLEQHWNTADEANRCSFVIGHRKVDNSDLLAVYIKGIRYSSEWAGNLTIGETGDHEGFRLAALEVYIALKDYIAAYYPKKDLKIWITGYSRAAAVSNVVAFNIIDRKELKVKQSDLFVYAFETPASISSDKAREYQCVHNIVTASDIVASVPPAAYGLSRVGTDHKMSSDPIKLNTCLHVFVDPTIKMPTFTPGDDYENPAEFLEYFLNLIMVAAPEEQPQAPSFESRSSYYSTIQTRLAYLVEILMKDNRAGLGALMEFLTEKGYIYALSWLTTEGLFYTDLKPLLDAKEIDYNAERLETACSLVSNLKDNTNLISNAASLLLAKDNVMYIINCHYPEVCYALLKGDMEI